MRTISQIAVVILLLSAFLSKQSAEAATYYFATTGNDSNRGKSAAPFRTINKGISLTVSGDTVYLGISSSSFTMKRNAVAFGSPPTDSTFATGVAGVASSGGVRTTAGIDSWEKGSTGTSSLILMGVGQ